VKTGTNEEEIY